MMQILIVDTEAQRQERLAVKFDEKWKKITADQRMKFIRHAIDETIRRQIQAVEQG